MRSDQRPPRRYPKAPIERRIYAFLLDFITVWLVSSLAGIFFFQLVFFLVAWFGVRVVAAYRFQGQSLGHWAFNLTVIEARRGRVPDLITFVKRESIVGGGAFLAMVGLNYGLPNFLTLLILISPLVVDLVVAIGDEQYQQSLHDRVIATVVVPAKRGFSLDLRVRRLVDRVRDRVRK